MRYSINITWNLFFVQLIEVNTHCGLHIAGPGTGINLGKSVQLASVCRLDNWAAALYLKQHENIP